MTSDGRVPSKAEFWRSFCQGIGVGAMLGGCVLIALGVGTRSALLVLLGVALLILEFANYRVWR